MRKRYVGVESICYADGSFRPLKIFWDDGRIWKITRVLHIAEPVTNEFEGIRYTILIGSAEKYIYRSGSKWYVLIPEERIQMEGDSS